MSKSKKEKNRLALVRNARKDGLISISDSSLKIKVKYINDELMDYNAYKKGFITEIPKPLHEIRQNFDYIISQIKPIIEKHKYSFVSNIAKHLNHFEFDISVWISEQGISSEGIPFYSLNFYVSLTKPKKPDYSYSNHFGCIYFAEHKDFNNLIDFYFNNVTPIYEINDIGENFNHIVSTNRNIFALSEHEAKSSNKNSNVEVFEGSLHNFIDRLENNYNYSVYNNDLYFLRTEYYICDKVYWAIIPERKSDYSTSSHTMSMSNFREISENKDNDFISAMIESKILNVGSEETKDMSIQDIINLSKMFDY